MDGIRVTRQEVISKHHEGAASIVVPLPFFDARFLMPRGQMSDLFCLSNHVYLYCSSHLY